MIYGWNRYATLITLSVSCGTPSFAIRVDVEPFTSTTLGSEIVYKCRSGLLPDGRMTSVCGEDGMWNPDPANLMCKGKTHVCSWVGITKQWSHYLINLIEKWPHAANCGVSRPPENGTIVNYTSTVEGSALLYQCNPGFSPVGEMTAVCAANGSWSPDPADVKCREIGMNVLLHRGNCIWDMLNDTTDGSNTWPMYQTVNNSIQSLRRLPQLINGRVGKCMFVFKCQWHL